MNAVSSSLLQGYLQGFLNECLRDIIRRRALSRCDGFNFLGCSITKVCSHNSWPVAGAGWGSFHSSPRNQRGNELVKLHSFYLKSMLLAPVCWVVLHVQKPAADPFDTLGSLLPSTGPAPAVEPVYTGPNVQEVQHSHSGHACVSVCIEWLALCGHAELHGCVTVWCMCHSMESPVRRLRSVERETTRCLQATDLKIWSVHLAVLIFSFTSDLLL